MSAHVRYWHKADMSLSALHMSAFGGKADMAVCENPLLRSLLGVKRTCRFALQMSAFDPKRTSAPAEFAGLAIWNIDPLADRLSLR